MCGDCASSKKAMQCQNIPLQSLTPERNTPIQLTITPKDTFNGATAMPSGGLFLVTLLSSKYEWQLDFKAGYKQDITELKGVTVTQNEWTLAIETQSIEQIAGVTVTQVSGGVTVTGTLKTSLSGGATTSIVISVASGVTFVSGVEVVIGTGDTATTIVLGNVNTATKTLSVTGTLKTALTGDTTSVIIETAKGVVFLSDADVVIGTSKVGSANLATATENSNTIVGDAPAVQQDGTYLSTITPNSAGNFTMTIEFQSIDPLNPLLTIKKSIAGSPYAVTSIEPVCPANSQVDPTVVNGGCQCAPGYTPSGTSTASALPTAAAMEPGKSSCVPCAVGKYKSSIGSETCSKCPMNKVAEFIGSKRCIYCAAGTGIGYEPMKCASCPIGYANAAIKQGSKDATTGKDLPGTQCTECGTGFVALVTGTSACVSCPAGSDASAIANCELCVPGKHRNEELNLNPATDTPTTCSACDAGKSAPLAGSSNCTVCPHGQYADKPSMPVCLNCLAGTFSATTQSTICTSCPGGYYAPVEEARHCDGCTVGMFSPNEGGAVECTSCKRNPDTMYAAPKSSKCSGCVSPLQIRTGSQAASVTDCACPIDTYLSKGTVTVSPVCSICPDGGTCPQGTENISMVAAKPGYWRPNPTVNNFWKCPVSVITGDGSEWRNWMTCYGGTESQCAPVFEWRTGTIKSGGAVQRVQQAMEITSVPVSVADPKDFSAYLNESIGSGTKAVPDGVTLSQAIAAYMTYVHTGSNRFVQASGYVNNTSVRSMTSKPDQDFLEFFQNAEGLWIDNKFISKADIQQFAEKQLVVGWMTGPLCAICPDGTGRQGDFKSDSPCEPCPTDNATNAGIVFGLFCAMVGMVVLFVYGQIKKGAHELHLEQEHIREHNATKKSEELITKESMMSVQHGSNDEFGNETMTTDQAAFQANPMKPNQKRPKAGRRGSTHVYKHAPTKFSKDSTLKSLQDHLRLQREHGTLSGNMMSHKQVLTGMSRIMMSYLQVVAIARAVPIQWPREVIITLDAFAVISAPSLSMVSVDCALGSGRAVNLQNQASMAALNTEVGLKLIYQKFIMLMMVPAMAFIIPIIFWGLYWFVGGLCLKKTGCKCCFPWIHEMPSKEANFHKYKNLDDLNTGELKHVVIQRYKITVMVITFLFYPTVSRGVIQMWSCQTFGDSSYLISDMSVLCSTSEHTTFMVLAGIFFVLFVIGIPAMGVRTLVNLMPGIHFNPTLPISEFNPTAGRKFERKDRAELLRMKLEATQVYGFMWEGLQQKGWAPVWEWSVIMSRKVVIIMIILLLQNMAPDYQLTFTLIVMFMYNLLHVKFHPYDLFYHDRLEMLSLISSEMTLFGGLLITFLNEDKTQCITNCGDFQGTAEAYSSAIGYVIIFFNLVYLIYWFFGFLFHMYFVLIPARCRCKKVEDAAGEVHKHIKKHAPGLAKHVLANTNHSYLDHHEVTVKSTSVHRNEQDVQRQVDTAVAMNENNKKLEKQKLQNEKATAHERVQERLKAKRLAKKKNQVNGEGKNNVEVVEIEMTEGKNKDVASKYEVRGATGGGKVTEI